MVENGGEEPVFNVDKITAFEVTSYSAIQYADLQNSNENFSKILSKLIPSYFQDDDKEELMHILTLLKAPESATTLAKELGYETRTFKGKYISKMMQAGVVAMTIPEKPTSGKQKYRIVTEDED